MGIGRRFTNLPAPPGNNISARSTIFMSPRLKQGKTVKATPRTRRCICHVSYHLLFKLVIFKKKFRKNKSTKYLKAQSWRPLWIWGGLKRKRPPTTSVDTQAAVSAYRAHLKVTTMGPRTFRRSGSVCPSRGGHLPAGRGTGCLRDASDARREGPRWACEGGRVRAGRTGPCLAFQGRSWTAKVTPVKTQGNDRRGSPPPCLLGPAPPGAHGPHWEARAQWDPLPRHTGKWINLPQKGLPRNSGRASVRGPFEMRGSTETHRTRIRTLPEAQ